MSYYDFALIAVGLSMDAFAVAVCRGLYMGRVTLRGALTVGLYFGAFQAAMPVLGYLAGAAFASHIEKIDHWVAFGLLAFIGVRMIVESLKNRGESGECDTCEGALCPKKMLPLALATSVDALAVGVTFAFIKVKIAPAAGLIGLTTLLISMLGVKLGGVFGLWFKAKAELAGGAILVLMGTKILLEHLGVIGF